MSTYVNVEKVNGMHRCGRQSVSRPTLADLFFSLRVLVLLLLVVGVFAGGAIAADGPSASWELAADGQELFAVLHLDPGEGFYVYGPQPQFTGMPTSLKLRQGGQGATILYPPAQSKLDKASGREVLAYTGPTPIFVRLGAQHKSVTLKGSVRMLACTDTTCRPVILKVRAQWQDVDPAALPKAQEQPWWLLLQVSEEAAPKPGAGIAAFSKAEPTPEDSAVPSPITAPIAPSIAPPDAASVAAPASVPSPRWRFDPVFFAADLEVAGLGKAILFGLLAGLILNFMPCVLPVVGLKISTLLSAAGQENEAERMARFREHNIFFSAGVLIYFLVLAGLFGMAGLAWGELFQKPGVVFGLAVAVFLLGLSLFGVVDLPVVDLKGSSDSGESGGKLQALFTGMLATLLATPCSGPLLGGVLGWTLWQPPHVVMAVFLAIGVGMASPYLLMVVRPGLARFFPRPGAWVRYMERSVAFFLMATCVYLITILPRGMVGPALVTLLACAFGAWMWGGWTNLAHSFARRWSVRAAAVGVAVLVGWAAFAPRPQAQWESFDAAMFSRALGRERIILDFTADWCPNCKVLEQLVLTHDRLAQWRDKYGARLIQVDMTTMDAESSALLKSLGSASIPVVAIFQTGDDAMRPVILRDLFTGAQIETALERSFK